MEAKTTQTDEPTEDDPWPLDHHIEEVLGTFDDAARGDGRGPDAEEPRLG